MNISFKNVFKKKHHENLYRHEFHAYRDWGIMLIFFTASFVGLALFHIYFFLAVTNDQLVDKSLTSPTTVNTINKVNLKKVADNLVARTALFESKKGIVPPIVDPSR